MGSLAMARRTPGRRSGGKTSLPNGCGRWLPANHSKVVEVPVAEPWPSFTTLGIDRLEIWLLHNNHVPLVGVLTVPPEPGSSWAAAGGYVDLEVPTHAAGWRPQLLGAAVLNAPLEPSSLDLLASAERELADRYKPQTIGHVIFNYWA